MRSDTKLNAYMHLDANSSPQWQMLLSNAPFPGRQNRYWLGVITSRETLGGMYSITIINWSCLQSIAPGLFRSPPITCCPHSQYCPLPRFVFICMIYLLWQQLYINRVWVCHGGMIIWFCWISHINIFFPAVQCPAFCTPTCWEQWHLLLLMGDGIVVTDDSGTICAS